MAKALTSKDIRIALKHGLTIFELMQDYHFASEEQLFSAIGRLFTKGCEASQIISELKRNSKKAKSHSREKKDLVPSSTEEPVKKESVAEDPVNEEPAANSIEVVSVDTHNPEVQAPSESISSLEAEEEDLSKKLMTLESIHKELVSCHHSSKKKLLRMQKILEEIQRLMEEHQKNLCSELETIQKTSEEMAKVSFEAKTISSRLKIVRAQLDELKKASIFVYASGNIEIENGSIPASLYSDEALNSKFMELIQYPRAKEFSVTLKDLTTVARLLLWTEYLASSGLAFDISFDSEEVQRFYESVIAPSTTTA